MANSSRGIMKITTENIDKIEGHYQTRRSESRSPYETISSLKGVSN